jgi:hypothetical protein
MSSSRSVRMLWRVAGNRNTRCCAHSGNEGGMFGGASTAGLGRGDECVLDALRALMVSDAGGEEGPREAD